MSLFNKDIIILVREMLVKIFWEQLWCVHTHTQAVQAVYMQPFYWDVKQSSATFLQLLSTQT